MISCYCFYSVCCVYSLGSALLPLLVRLRLVILHSQVVLYGVVTLGLIGRYIHLLPHFAFFFFLIFWFQREDFRKLYQEENPEVKSMREVISMFSKVLLFTLILLLNLVIFLILYKIGKTCGEKWKTMTYEVTHLLSHFIRDQLRLSLSFKNCGDSLCFP